MTHDDNPLLYSSRKERPIDASSMVNNKRTMDHYH